MVSRPPLMVNPGRCELSSEAGTTGDQQKASDLVVDEDKRGIELRRSAFIGDDLDTEPVIGVPVLSTERVFEARRRDHQHFLDRHALERGRAFTDCSWICRCETGRPDGESQRNG
jgi:hypothetical protein